MSTGRIRGVGKYRGGGPTLDRDELDIPDTNPTLLRWSFDLPLYFVLLREHSETWVRQLRGEKIERITNFIECSIVTNALRRWERSNKPAKRYATFVRHSAKTGKAKERERERETYPRPSENEKRGSNRRRLRFVNTLANFRFAKADVVGRTSSFFHVSRQRRVDLKM